MKKPRWWPGRALFALALALGLAGCGGSGVPMPGQAEVPVDSAPPGTPVTADGEQVHVYIAHGREITETFRMLQEEIDEERSKSGEPAVNVRRDLATTMNVEDARRRIAAGTLRMRWAIPGEAKIESGIVWSVPISPRK